MNISKERKNEIDNILKENHKKFENGELKKHSLKEFDEKHKIRKKVFEKLCLKMIKFREIIFL